MLEHDKEEALEPQDQQLVRMVADLPQFDVPEQLTQRIMSSVESEAARNKSMATSGLLAPIAVVAGVAMCTVLPMDSWEGMLSTGISFGALYLVQLLIRSAKTEELAI